MRLRCECGREFSPLSEEDCPSCGATHRFQYIQGWVELKCPCGHVAWREEDHTAHLHCPACGRELVRPPDAPIHPERPDAVPSNKVLGPRSIPSEMLLCAAAWVLVLRGATIVCDGVVYLASRSSWTRRIDDWIPAFILAALLGTHGVRLYFRRAVSRVVTVVLATLWVWYALGWERPTAAGLLWRVLERKDLLGVGTFLALLPDAVVMAIPLSTAWYRGIAGGGAEGPLASVLSAPRVRSIGGWLGLLVFVVALAEFLLCVVRFVS